MTQVWLYVDPFCPWCFQTARWVLRLEELGVVELSWGFFSLEIQNAPESDVASHTRSVPSMRVATLVREELGQAAVGRFYMELAGRMHFHDEQLGSIETIESALTSAGLDSGYASRALADPATATRLRTEHQALSDRGFGVPTIVLDQEDGPAIFGPVIPRLPDDAEALELWDHVSWIIRNPNVYELKRIRSEHPDLEGVRLGKIRRAARRAVVER
jgi:predicted DsbA family dithiol-disulfide isomerase